MSYTCERFGSLALSIANSTTDIGTGQYRAVYTSLSGGGAYDHYGTLPSPRDMLPLTVQALWDDVSGAALQAKVDSLRAKVGTRDRLYIRTDDGLVRWAWARLRGYDAQRTVDNIIWYDLTLHFDVVSPIWNGLYHGVAVNPLDAAPATFDVGYALDDGADITTLNTSPKTITVTNAGNATVANGIFTLTAIGTPITAVTVANAANGDGFTWTGTLAATKSLVVDCGAAMVTNDGADAYATFTPVADDWLRLAAGGNVLTVTLTGGGVTSTWLCSFFDGWT